MAATTRRTGHDVRRERTRALLLDAARALVAENGVAGLKISEVTARAQVALGSFYNHFATKEDLVAAVVEHSLEAIASGAVDAPPDADAARVVSVATRRFVRLAYDDPELARLTVNLSHDDSLFRRAIDPYAREAIARGVASGRFEIADAEVSLRLVTGGALSLMRAILEGEQGPGADVAFAQSALRSLGVDGREAGAIAAEPL